MNDTPEHAALTIHENGGTLGIVRGRTELCLSSRHGAMLGIYDRASGKWLCGVGDRPEMARLFRLVALRRAQRSRAADAHLQAGFTWERTDHGVALRYANLAFEGELSACAAEVRIEPGGEDELLLTLTVRNNAPEPVHEVQFPMLPGWRQVEGQPPVELMAGAKWQSRVGKLPTFGPPAYAQWYQQTGVEYPGGLMAMPWLNFSAGDTGLALTNYMPRPYRGGVGGINLAGHEKGNTECYWWTHHPLIKTGREWTSPPVGLRVHGGDWHDTADRYYAWFAGNVGISLRQPDSLRRSIGFQNILLRSFDGTFHNAAASLPEHARAGLACGVEHLAVWDENTLGNYCFYEPNRDLFDYTGAEREALREAIRLAQAEGATVSALSDWRHINVTSDLYPRYRSEAVLSMDGSEQRETWLGGNRTARIFTPHLGGHSIILSPRSPATRQRFDELLERYVALGYTALFYDQPFLYQLDYNHMGEESRPDDASAACYDHAAYVRERLRARHPDAYLIGEMFDIFAASRALDLQMEWNFCNQGIEDLARVHYSCPNALLSYVIDYTTTGEAHASRAFAAGLLLCITIDGGEASLAKRPPLGAHIARLAALRKRCAGRIAHGRFRHTRGLDAQLADGMAAYVFESEPGPAVTIAAGETGGTARITLDPSLYPVPAAAPSGMLYHLDGRAEPRPAAGSLEVTLPANGVAVWYPSGAAH